MIAVTGHKFTIGKEDYSPYAIEIQYFRTNKRYWSICFERIRKTGCKIISTVVPWSLHEDNRREFDFSGFTDPAKDLVVFIELAREFGFKIILRPGPINFAELKNGGIPTFLNKYPEVFACDSEGKDLFTKMENGLPEFRYPSSMNSRMQNFIRHYFNGLTEIIKNYIYPRGPLFLVELDAGTYYGGSVYPWEGDYNTDITSSHYPEFLQIRYDAIKDLNSAYGEKLEEYSDIKPPDDFTICKENSLTKQFDWFRFKEYLIGENAHFLIDLYKSFSCEPLFYQTLYFHKSFQAPMTPIIESNGEIFPTVEITWNNTSTSILQRIRYLRANSEFPWASLVSLGSQSTDIKTSKQHFPITADAAKYLLTLTLAGGIKGFSQYKFTESENWYDAALSADGTIQESYEVVNSLMGAIVNIDLGSFQQETNIGMACCAQNNWISLMEDPGEYSYIKTLTEFTMPQLSRDLDMLKQDFVIPDLDNPDTLEGLKYLIVPITEIMDEQIQELLLEKARKGVHLILIGLLPKYNSNMGNCQILANAIHCKTPSLGKIGNITVGKNDFPAYIFGSINSTEKKCKKLASYGSKIVAAKITKFKGSITLLTFDASSQGNHHKIGFLRDLLLGLHIEFPINSSHPRLRVFIHKGEKSGMIYLLNSQPTLAFKKSPPSPTKVVVQMDLRKLGYKGSKIRMVDIYTNEEILTTMDELKEGLYFTLKNLDSRAYHFTFK